MKAQIVEHLKKSGHEVVDLGPFNEERVDYPDFGFKLAEAIRDGKAPLGIAICGSGIGISIAVNRYKGLRCALAHDVTSARLARSAQRRECAGTGSAPDRPRSRAGMRECILSTPFEGGRHAGASKNSESAVRNVCCPKERGVHVCLQFL